MHCYLSSDTVRYKFISFYRYMICYSPEVYSPVSISLEQFCVDKTLKKAIRVFITLKTCMPQSVSFCDKLSFVLLCSIVQCRLLASVCITSFSDCAHPQH